MIIQLCLSAKRARTSPCPLCVVWDLFFQIKLGQRVCFWLPKVDWVVCTDLVTIPSVHFHLLHDTIDLHVYTHNPKKCASRSRIWIPPKATLRVRKHGGGVPGRGGRARTYVRTRGVGQASRAHIFAESVAQNPYIFRIAGLRVYRPAGTAGVNLNKVRR